MISRDIDSDYMQALASRIEGLRLQAINLKENGRLQQSRTAWKEYYNVIGSFTTPVDMFYALHISLKEVLMERFSLI